MGVGVDVDVDVGVFVGVAVAVAVGVGVAVDVAVAVAVGVIVNFGITPNGRCEIGCLAKTVFIVGKVNQAPKITRANKITRPEILIQEMLLEGFTFGDCLGFSTVS